MTEYRLENGDKIEVGKLYKTRDGRKAFVSFFAAGNMHCDSVIYGMIVNEYISRCWLRNGLTDKGLCNTDLISLWPEPVTKCDQLGKIKVTDEMVNIAWNVYRKIGSLPKRCMKDALEAVFAYIANQPEKPDSSIEQDNDGWIKHDGSRSNPVPFGLCSEVKFKDGKVIKNSIPHLPLDAYFWDDVIAYRIVSESKEEKQDIDKLSDQIQSITYQVLEITSMIEAITEGIKEPKKQTLLEFAFRSEEKLSSTILLDNLKPTRIFEIISRYLEQNK